MSGYGATAATVEVQGLGVEIVHRRSEATQVLREVGFRVGPGEMHGLVGETGSGKSMSARAIMGLLPRGGRITAGQIFVEGRDISGFDERKIRTIRGSVVGMIFQNPRSALYPLRTVGAQLESVLRTHRTGSGDVRRSAGRDRARRIRDTLRTVGIRDPERVAGAYPHQLSGGMAQRAVIAAVLIAEPRVLIADEPTTGLDATVQRQILELIAGLQNELGLAVLMITHDLAVVAQYCRGVTVMHDGTVVEQGDVHGILTAPTHPYTQRLLEASKLTPVDEARRAVATE